MKRANIFFIWVAILFFILLSSSFPIISKPKTSVNKKLPQFKSGSITFRRIKKNKVIRVGLQRDLQPFHIQNPVEKYPGIDVELAQKLSNYFQVRVEYSYYSIAGLIKNINNNKLDMAFGGISSNLERSPFVYFSRPYVITTAGALISKKSLPKESDSVEYNPKRFRSLRDIAQAGILNLGVQHNTANHQLLKRDPAFRKHAIKVFDSREALLKALKSGEVDALIADAIYIQSLLKKDDSLGRRYLALTKVYRPEFISILLPRGDLHFKYEIDFFLRDLERTRALKNLIDRYVSGDDWVSH